jgi:hypothetical protein
VQKRAAPKEWCRAESETLYKQALSEAARITGFSVSRGFEENRQKTWGEFEDFLASMGHGLDAERASDLDVIAFVQGWWLPAHKANCRTRFGGDGEKIASASAVKGVIQRISKSYSMMGRRE